MTRPTRPRNSSAFTLIELLVTISVLVILVGGVTPWLTSMKATSDHQSALSGVRRLASEARMRAIRADKPMQLAYDESTRSLEIQRMEDDGTTTTVQTVPLTTDLIPQRFEQEGQDVTASEFAVSFTPDGRANRGGLEFPDFSVTIDSNGGVRFIDGPLPAPEDQIWQAGDLEQRQ